MRSEDSLLPLLLVLGLGGVALWLYFRTPTTAKAPDCGIPVSAYGVSSVIPCGVVKTFVTQAKVAVGGIVKLPSSVFNTFTSAPGSQNTCPPGTTDKGWRGCFDSNGNVVARGSSGGKVGGEPSSFSAIPPVTAPIPARWSPGK